jgi:hypothetical protein
MTDYARCRDLAEAILGSACARCGSTDGPFAIDLINGGRQGVRESERRATVDARARPSPSSARARLPWTRYAGQVPRHRGLRAMTYYYLV